MSEAEVVWGQPPSALAVPEYLADLPEDQRLRERARRDANGADQDRPKRPYYASPTFSRPEVLRLLEFAHAPNGMPLQPKQPKAPRPPLDATAAELLAYTQRREVMLAQITEESESYFDRFRYWCGCDAQTKSQLAADAMFNLKEPNSPAWSICIPQDPIVPSLVIRAESAQLARIRYTELCGLWKEPEPTSGGSSPWSVTPYQEPKP
jgi:hypothetical protein